MTIRTVDIDKVRTLLKFQGINVTASDAELNVLVESKLLELEGLIGANIYPHDRTQITKSFYGSVYELDYYPVLNIAYLYVNDKLCSPQFFNFNPDLGLIYFDRFCQDDVIKVQYTTGISDNDFEYKVLPLLQEMLAYTISYGNANQRLNGLGGFVNSLHEGDLSMSFGGMSGSSGGSKDYGYNPKINTKIDELQRKYQYSSKVKIIGGRSNGILPKHHDRIMGIYRGRRYP